MTKLSFLCAALLALCLGACSHADDHADGEASDLDHGDGIVLSPSQAKEAGVKTAIVRPGNFSQVIPVSGRILNATGDESTISATVSGIVRVLMPLDEGAHVGAGATVFSISSKGLQEGDAVQKARIEYEAALRQYERDEKLVKDHIVSEKHFEASKTTLDNARLAWEALGARRGEGTGVTARLGGYVKELLVRDGDYVAVGQPLAKLTRNRTLQLRAEVPERYVSSMPNISSAKFRLSGSKRVYDLRQLNGRKISHGPAMTQNSHYLPLTFELNNASGMVAGAYAEVWLVCGTQTGVISLPITAITEEQGLFFVYVLDTDDPDRDKYHKVEVELGATDGDRVQVLRGLKGGEEVVVEGAMHVKLAAASGTVPGHAHNH